MRTHWFESTLQDLRLGTRRLCKDRLFTSVALLTLALGIGANTTMFSVVNSVLLRPLPGYQTGRLVRITDREASRSDGFIPPPLYLALRKQSESFEAVSGQQFCPYNLTGVGEPEQVVGPCTTANWFALQHASALLGRTFAPDEDQRGRARVVVLDYAFWKRKFNDDPKVIGRPISLNGAPWTVIGVMPSDFKPLGVSAPAIYTPDVIADNPAGLIVVARLKPGVSIEAARAELKVIGERLAHSDPGTWKSVRLTLTPALEQATGPQRPPLVLLMGAVCFVLLIACANVANLLLARSKARQQETSIRVALGASRSRIARLLLAEVFLLCSAASATAIGIAYLGIFALRPLLAYLPRADEISIDGGVFLWAMIAGWVTTLLAGGLPAMQSGAPGAAGMRARTTLRSQSWLLSCEVALALILLVGAGLLIRTFVNERNAPLGYDPSDTLTAFLALPASHSTAGSAEILYSRIRERLGAIPAVQSVATATSVPTGSGVGMSVDVEPEDHLARPGDAPAMVDIVSPNYFRTLGMRLKAGRAFTQVDRRGSAPVAIVSASIAEKYFGGKAVGRRLQIPAVNFELTDAAMAWAEIIGVVDNVAVKSIGEPTAAHIYLAEAQYPVRFTYLAVRADRAPTRLSSVIRRAVYAESPLTPLDEMKSMEERAAYLTAAPQRAMWLLGVFAGLAGLLSAVGMYAVTTYLTAQRVREIAIRMAVGASGFSLAGTIFRKPLLAITGGILMGLLGAVGLTRLLEALLFGVGHLDFATYAGAAIALVGCGVVAMLRPALRAIRMDVAGTLRQE